MDFDSSKHKTCWTCSKNITVTLCHMKKHPEYSWSGGAPQPTAQGLAARWLHGTRGPLAFHLLRSIMCGCAYIVRLVWFMNWTVCRRSPAFTASRLPMGLDTGVILSAEHTFLILCLITWDLIMCATGNYSRQCSIGPWGQGKIWHHHWNSYLAQICCYMWFKNDNIQFDLGQGQIWHHLKYVCAKLFITKCDWTESKSNSSADLKFTAELKYPLQRCGSACTKFDISDEFFISTRGLQIWVKAIADIVQARSQMDCLHGANHVSVSHISDGDIAISSHIGKGNFDPQIRG